MRWGIVGSEETKFTPLTAELACAEIVALLRPGDVVITGKCPRRGIDEWAAQIGRAMGLTVVEHEPKVHRWSDGYRPRNIKIAEDCEEAICITVPEYPATYFGKRSPICYHCKTTDHVASGGCWTVQYARSLGKPGRVIVVGRAA